MIRVQIAEQILHVTKQIHSHVEIQDWEYIGLLLEQRQRLMERYAREEANGPLDEPVEQEIRRLFQASYDLMVEFERKIAEMKNETASALGTIRKQASAAERYQPDLLSGHSFFLDKKK